MANRLVFYLNNNPDSLFSEELVEFQFYSGFAISQKQKSIKSLHENFIAKHPRAKVLEISTKSEDPLGVRLSAFNLKFKDEKTGREYPLENIFQSSKVYMHGGPYLDMLEISPADAKKDTRHHTSGDLIGFHLNEWNCPLEPKTMFYDWIYCKSLSQNPKLMKSLVTSGYDAFTDIEFNQNKSLNCQARAVAIFVGLYRKGILQEYLENKEKWTSIYNASETEKKVEQLSFDFGL